MPDSANAIIISPRAVVALRAIRMLEGIPIFQRVFVSAG
jgi:hypothetical protein